MRNMRVALFGQLFEGLTLLRGIADVIQRDTDSEHTVRCVP